MTTHERTVSELRTYVWLLPSSPGRAARSPGTTYVGARPAQLNRNLSYERKFQLVCRANCILVRGQPTSLPTPMVDLGVRLWSPDQGPLAEIDRKSGGSARR